MMTYRMTALALLLGTEILLASIAFDGDQLAAGGSALVQMLKHWGAWMMRWVVAMAVIFGGFAYLKHHTMPAAQLGALVRPVWLLGHVASLGGFTWASRAIYEGGAGSDGLVALWALLGVMVAMSAAFTLLPPRACFAFADETRSLALISAGAAALACGLGALSRHLWQPVTAATFALVKFLLGLVVSEMVIQPERFRLGTKKFTVIISQECSGLEGMGLFLIFGLLWLVLFRDELRFPQALTLLPVGVAAIYLLNAVRITVLALIGDAGFKDIAVRGFHSQAGWIAFCAVAFALLLASRRIGWIAAQPLPAVTAAEYPAAPYLVPFLAIMAAGILSQAMTAHFEWTYSLRLVAAVAALWTLRERYHDVDWRCDGYAVAAGAVVFALWIGVDQLMGATTTAPGMPGELAGASAGGRLAWLATRIAGAVVTVPITEELAFRGFGLRRWMAEDFEAVPWRAWNWVALGGSSVLFGLMHGGLWLAGIAAGLVYGGMMIWRGRLGDAIAAHATTNALLAVYVLVLGRWDLW